MIIDCYLRNMNIKQQTNLKAQFKRIVSIINYIDEMSVNAIFNTSLEW